MRHFAQKYQKQRGRKVGAVAFLLAGMLLMSGCSPKNASPSGATGAGQAIPATTPQTGAALTDADAQKFGTDFVAAATSDTNTLERFIDFDAVLDSAVAGLSMPEATLANFRAGVRSSASGASGLTGQIADGVKHGGSIALLRTHTQENAQRALFRFILPDSRGVTYLDMVLARRSDGQVRAVDIYNFSTGERITQTLRRSVLPLAASANRGLLERLAGGESDYLKHVSSIEAMVQAIKNGNPQQTITIYNSLPESLKRDKNIMLVRLRAAVTLGGTEYEQTLADYRAAFPNDASSDLLSIDYYILHEQYAEAVAAVDRMDKSVGGDPYLNSLRANIYVKAKEYDKALSAAQALVSALPDKVNYETLVGTALAARKFDAAAAAMTTMEQKFGTQFKDLSTVPQYAEFAASPEGKKWAQTHARP